MPNWEDNNVVIVGSAEQIDRVLDECFRVEDGMHKIDFDLIAPMPEEVRLTRSPLRVFDTQAEVDSYTQQNPAKKAFGEAAGTVAAVTAEEAVRRKAEYGALTWLDWASERWGCKWNASSHERPRRVAVEGEVQLQLRFQTPWSPPTPIFEEIERRFGVAVHAMTFDEGGFEVPDYGDPGRYMYEERRAVFGDDGAEVYPVEAVSEA